MARQLLLAGVRAELWSCAGRAQPGGDAGLQRRVVEALGLSVSELGSASDIEREPVTLAAVPPHQRQP